MGTRQHLISRHRIGMPAAGLVGSEPGPREPEDSIAAAVDALREMGTLVSRPCFDNPESLTHDRITAYALALLRLRECAGWAGLERLANACDALAVTVSRLIEDHRCASREECAALTRFVAHAKAMIPLSVATTPRAMPIPDGRLSSIPCPVA